MADEQTTVDRLRRQQKALAEFGLLAFRSHDLDEILHRACELVAEGLDVRLAKVLELLPDGGGLLVRSGVGWKPGVVGTVTIGADSQSPGGYALEHDEPVVSTDLATERRFRIPEVLREHGIKSMVNVIIAGGGDPFGVLEVDTPQHREFDEDDIAFVQNYANLLAGAIDRHRAHRSMEEAAREQRVLAQELAHRVKNTLGLVQALAAQMIAEEPAARALRDSFLGRLQALSRAEELLFERRAHPIDLAELAERALEPFEGVAGRIALEGPGLRVAPRSGRMLMLVLHELAANSTKYGALSAPGGRVSLFWTIDRGTDEAPDETPDEAPGARRVQLRWTESGGPAVEAPSRRGFGTRLLTTLAGYELDGGAELNYWSNGLEYQLKFPEPRP